MDDKVLNDRILHQLGSLWSDEMREAVIRLPLDERNLLLKKAALLLERLSPRFSIEIAATEIEEDPHLVLRVLVDAVADELWVHASDQLRDLKQKLDDEARFYRMMD